MKLREAGVILKHKDKYPLRVVIEAKKRITEFKRAQQALKLNRHTRHITNDGKRIRRGNKEHQPFQPRNEEAKNKPYLGYKTPKKKVKSKKWNR